MPAFAFTDEQIELRRTVRTFLERKSPEQEVRRLMETETGYDPQVWAQFAGELGLVGLAVPEEYGGAGFGFVELMVTLEELGRTLACLPYPSTAVLATHTLLESGDETACKHWLPAIASGELIATLAWAEDDGCWDEADVSAAAELVDGRWSLSGVKSFVTDGHTAGLLLVVARSASGLALFAVAPDAHGLTRAPLATMDQTRRLARVELNQTPATLVGIDGGAAPVLDRVRNLAAVALAAEQVGGAQFVMDSAVQYAKDRVQYGRTIGGFQAIKHKCTEILFEVESAKSVAYYAGWAAADASAELAEVAALAKAFCSDAYVKAAAENIQIHGGIGFTWEHSAQLYFKRAKSSELLFGSASYWREQLADRMGL
jgi:alkylation response protein AidB-like acyl-CoA dehydrogenase